MTESLADRMTVSLSADAVSDVLRQAHQAAQRGDRAAAERWLSCESLVHWTPEASCPERARSQWLVLGHTFQCLDRLSEAIESYEQVRRLGADEAVTYELIRLYRNQGRFSLAYERAAEAVQRWPGVAELESLYAECLLSMGRLEEGMARYRDLIARGQVTAETHLQALWHLSLMGSTTRRILHEAHCHWARLHARPARFDHRDRPGPSGRRWRIGYLSPDFRAHSVTYTFEPILDGHDRDRVELFGYGIVAHPDETTERLAARFDHYRDLRGVGVERIAEQVHRDGVDILVGLASHCSSLCLQVLAQRPAPIQVDIGSVCTTGLTQVDYRVTDPLQDPPDSQATYVERLVPIESGFVPYHGPGLDLPVGPLPARARGYVTFGSFANHLKINETVVATWSRILRAVPGSRLLVKTPAGRDTGAAEALIGRFVQQGIEPDRLTLLGWIPKPDHWRVYDRIDIALDTFPYNGGLTTLEALWMGVPTVTVAGETFVARTGLAILTRAGLRSLVARDPDQMVVKAVALAGHLDALAQLRAGLRPSLLAGPLCDRNRLACELEAAFGRMIRQCWPDGCEECH